MHNSIFHRIIAIVMAIYLPVALIGVPLHKHYCEGKLLDMQVLFETDSCHDGELAAISCCAEESSACHGTEIPSFDEIDTCSNDSCCDDELELLRADVNLIAQNSSNLDTNQALMAILVLTGYSISFQNQSPDHIINKDDPPGPYLNGQERLIRHEQFLC